MWCSTGCRPSSCAFYQPCLSVNVSLYGLANHWSRQVVDYFHERAVPSSVGHRFQPFWYRNPIAVLGSHKSIRTYLQRGHRLLVHTLFPALNVVLKTRNWLACRLSSYKSTKIVPRAAARGTILSVLLPWNPDKIRLARSRGAWDCF